MAEGLSDWERPVRVARVTEQGGKRVAELSTPAMRGEGEQPEGWTAYAPLQVVLERVDGDYRVHLELAVIR